MSDRPFVDPCRCPLCGKVNLCAVASPPDEGERPACWCALEKFSAELLQRVPPQAQRKACICQACVQASQVGA